MKTVRVFLLLMVFSASILAFQTVYSSPGEKQLLIITPHWEGIREEYGKAFANWYRERFGEEVEVVWEGLGTSDAVAAIEDWYSKHEEGRWDIIWGGGVDPFLKLKGEGLLESYSPLEDPELAEILSRIPESFAGIPMYDREDYMWFGTALSGFGIIYNKPVLKQLGLPEPVSWSSLADERALGWVASADPRHSGSTHMCYEIILQGYGWEDGWRLITLIGANIKEFTQHSSAVPEAVAAGQAAYGLAIDFYAWAQIAKVGPENIGYIMPEGLTVINPDSIAMLKNPPHPELAKAFIKFVLSEDGQKLWMLPAGKYPDGPSKYTLGRMSVLPELYSKLGNRSIVPVNPFEVKNVLEYNSSKGGMRWSVVNDLFGALIIDTHDELVAAWKKIIENKDKVPEETVKEAVDEMVKVPVSEDEALALASRWSDQELRNRKISEWRSFAKQKYAQAITIVEEAIKRLEEQKRMQQMIMVAGVVAAIALVLGVAYMIKRRSF